MLRCRVIDCRICDRRQCCAGGASTCSQRTRTTYDLPAAFRNRAHRGQSGHAMVSGRQTAAAHMHDSMVTDCACTASCCSPASVSSPCILRAHLLGSGASLLPLSRSVSTAQPTCSSTSDGTIDLFDWLKARAVALLVSIHPPYAASSCMPGGGLGSAEVPMVSQWY